MASQVIVHKGRTNTKEVHLGWDASADTFSSQVRTTPDQSGVLIMAWSVTKPNGGADGVLLLTVDDTITSQIDVSSGWMDLKRVSGGEPLAVFDRPLEVIFRGTVTA